MAAKSVKFPFIDGNKDLPRDKDNDVREIRKWLETQPQLPKFNDEFLHLFLHCNYYNLEETKSNIEAYFSLRSTSPELFHDRSLSNSRVRTGLDNHLFGISPKRTPEGYQVIFIALNEKNLQNYVHSDSAKATFMFFDMVTSECGLCPGYIFVYDSKAFTLSMFMKMHFSILLKLTRYFQDAAPVRVINVVCLNSMSLVDRIISICRPFMKSTLFNKLQFYGVGSDLSNFYKIVPRECVFDEYGGTAGSIEIAHEKVMNLLETKYSKWIEDESYYAVEESKKEPKPAKRSFFSFCFDFMEWAATLLIFIKSCHENAFLMIRWFIYHFIMQHNYIDFKIFTFTGFYVNSLRLLTRIPITILKYILLHGQKFC